LSEDELDRLLAYAAARESARTYALLAVTAGIADARTHHLSLAPW
jgi:uncharacterized membrane protein YoaK (UPF0700 family)